MWRRVGVGVLVALALIGGLAVAIGARHAWALYQFVDRAYHQQFTAPAPAERPQ